MVCAMVKRLACVWLVVAVVAALLSAGRSVFFCAPMGALMDVPCCERDVTGDEHAPAGVEEISDARYGCCEKLSLSRTPPATTRDRMVAPLLALRPPQAAPLVAVGLERTTTTIPVEAPRRPPDRYALCVMLM
jgi:hypothetical protein